jgi:Lon protease-like protein
VELLPPDEDARIEEKFSACPKLLKAVIDKHGTVLVAEPMHFDSASWVSSRLAEILPVPLGAKQKLLELQDAGQRIEILSKFLEQHSLSG